MPVAHRFAGAALLLVCAATAQDPFADPVMLARIKAHMREELSRLSNYTCLETIDRFRNRPNSQSSRLEQADIVRLEVVYSDHKEWYGAPGDRAFSTDNPEGLVSNGLIGTGPFATTMANVFIADTARVGYGGHADLGYRTVAKYNFHLPSPALSITLAGGFGTTGEEGSFWVDPQTLDLIRLESHAIEIPLYLPLAETSTTVTYARTQIGGVRALLAQQADMHLLETGGQESYDRIEFTHCRAFSAESALRFDSNPGDVPAATGSEGSRTVTAPGAILEAVPPFLPVTLELTTPITERDAVGTLIAARVLGNVVRKKKIVIPNGASVKGRIRRLERYLDSASKEFVVGLEFTEVEATDGRLRFYADLVRTEKRPDIHPSYSEKVLVRSHGGVEAQTQTVTLRELPGVASFFVDGATFTIPSGFRMVWRTRGLIHGE
jgi:hypothetical protein